MTAEFSPRQVRHMFFDREGQRCFYCRRVLSWSLRGSMLAGGWSVHHRKPRGMGGTREAMSYAHGIAICGTGVSGCHGWIEQHREISLELGLLIPKSATTDEYRPENVRVRDKAGRWFLLTHDGRAVEVEGVPR